MTLVLRNRCNFVVPFRAQESVDALKSIRPKHQAPPKAANQLQSRPQFVKCIALHWHVRQPDVPQRRERIGFDKVLWK